MAQSAAERARAQRRTARELREGRYEVTIGRDYRKAIERLATPGAVMDKAKKLFASDASISGWSKPVTFNIRRMTESQRHTTISFEGLEDWKFLASIQSPGNVWWYHAMSQDYIREWDGVTWELPT
jgi:hypothetical protein